MKETLRLIRRKAVEQRTGLSRSSIYRLAAENAFPKSVSITGSRAVAWVESEVDAWLEQRIKESRAG